MYKNALWCSKMIAFITLMPHLFRFKKWHNKIFIFDTALNDAPLLRCLETLENYTTSEFCYFNQIFYCDNDRQTLISWLNNRWPLRLRSYSRLVFRRKNSLCHSRREIRKPAIFFLKTNACFWLCCIWTLFKSFFRVERQPENFFSSFHLQHRSGRSKHENCVRYSHSRWCRATTWMKNDFLLPPRRSQFRHNPHKNIP